MMKKDMIMQSNCTDSKNVEELHRHLLNKRLRLIYNDPAGPLVGLLRAKSGLAGDDIDSLGPRLWLSTAIFQNLLGGKVEPKKQGQEFFVGCSLYTGLPVVLIRVLAGDISIRDFAIPGNSVDFLDRKSVQVNREMKGFAGRLSDSALSAFLIFNLSNSETDVGKRLPYLIQGLQNAALVDCDASQVDI